MLACPAWPAYIWHADLPYKAKSMRPYGLAQTKGSPLISDTKWATGVGRLGVIKIARLTYLIAGTTEPNLNSLPNIQRRVEALNVTKDELAHDASSPCHDPSSFKPPESALATSSTTPLLCLPLSLLRCSKASALLPRCLVTGTSWVRSCYTGSRAWTWRRGNMIRAFIASANTTTSV